MYLFHRKSKRISYENKKQEKISFYEILSCSVIPSDFREY